MKFVAYQVDKKKMIGIVSEDEQWIFPLSSFGVDYNSMLDVVKELSDSELQLLEYASKKEPYSIIGSVKKEDVILLAPIKNPEQDIICLGLNYDEHAKESAKYKQELFERQIGYPVYFSKRVNEAVASGGVIPPYTGYVEGLDYEVELAVILKKDAKNIASEQVKDYIFGYTILNDVSARNLQSNHKQWFLGKSLDGFAPMGPYIVTVDSIPYPPEIGVRSYVNGELRQDGNTKDMIHSIDQVISQLSTGMTLKAGTIISTGTPAGVGMGFDPPRFLQSGDQVVCEIEGIGRLENVIG